MTTSEEEITRGHELYLRHLLLLGQAAPVGLKAILDREVSKRQGVRLAQLIDEKKDSFNNYDNAALLFQDDEVATNIDSWDTRLLCVVILVLFKPCLTATELEAIVCVGDQRKDLEKYAQYASLSYNTFATQWDTLHSKMLTLIEDIDETAKFKCKRMIHSFKAEPIRVNRELIKIMKQTNDVNRHVQLAIEDKVVPKIHGEQEDSCDENERTDHQYDTPAFTENLQDALVYIDESAILTCKLNVSDKAVKWQHDSKPVEEADNLLVVNKKDMHWLAISRAKLTDSGRYSCVCGNTSTEALLHVTEKPPLKIVENLHVATIEANVRENEDIVLSCSVDRHTNKLVWRHNDKKIEPCDRRHISVQKLEHRLTIRNAMFEDEGDYKVDFGDASSSTTLTLKGNLNMLHKKQLTEELYRNWIRVALGLKYLKVGLEGFSDIAVGQHHSEILAHVTTTVNSCTSCTTELLLPNHPQKTCPNKAKCLCSKQPRKRRICPNGGFCSTFHDQILYDHRFDDPLLKNTDIQKWSSDPWSVATCYISTTGYKGKTSAKEVDCSGLLSLFINNTFFHRSLGDIEINGETDLFKQTKDARNEILHSANYELAEGQLQDFIKLFIKTLEIRDVNGKAPLSGQPGVQMAIDQLNELRKHQIEVHISKDLQKHIKDLQEHAMNEVADNVQEAMKQSTIKDQQLEEKLKKTEEDLQLLRDLRLRPSKSKVAIDATAPFELELHIRVVGPTEETSTKGKQRIFKSMKDSDANLSMTRGATVHSTDQSVHRLLGYITSINDCKLVDVFETGESANIKIHCFTCQAIADCLKLINGNKFQKETCVLRECLEMQENIKSHDVIVNCSSESIENTRKRLGNRAPMNDFSCGKHHGTQCTWYCSDHDKFCCSACKDSDHSACVGIKQVVSERSYGMQKQSLTFKRKIGEYNVRIKNRLTNRSDNDVRGCGITSICMLPNGKILLVDYGNNRLKKLDSSYNVVSHCDIPGSHHGLCYIGDDRAAVGLLQGRIQFVNISGSMKLEHRVKLNHPCNALACHGDTLYVRGVDTIYTYNRDCQQKHVLYKRQDLEQFIYFNDIAISDDGERIYIACDTTGLITIDKTGDHLFTLRSDEMKNCRAVCIVGDGTVLVLDTHGRVYQVDYSGKQILGTVVSQTDGLYELTTLCYDRRQCRLIITRNLSHSITVFELKYHSSGT